MVAALAASIVAAVAYGFGSILQSVGARKATAAGGHGLKGLTGVVRQLPYLGGLACDFVAWLLSLYAVRTLPVFVVQTILASSLAVTTILARFVLHTRLDRATGIAIGVSIAGMVLVGASAGPERAPHLGHGFTVALLIGVIAMAGVAVLAERRSKPVLLGAIAGIAFALTAVAARELQSHRHPLRHLLGLLFFTLLLSSAIGLVVHARALQQGRVGPVTAAMWSAEIVAATIIGVAVVGDRVRAGFVPAAAIGMALSLGATLALARSQEQVH
jgi:drug/metabolite transporter (DMT)-like permease